MTATAPGMGPCGHCGHRVLHALAATGELVALDSDYDGPLVVRWDITGTPRVRTHPQAVLGEREFRYAEHDVACTALANVRPIASAKSARSRRPERPATERRHASAC